MDRQRREFLKQFSQFLLYRSLPLSQLLALSACVSGEESGTIEVDATVANYTPLISTPMPTSARFAAIADFGTGDREERDVAELIKSWEVDFIVTAGDNNYYNGKASTIDEHIGQFYHQYIYPYKGTYGPGADVNRFFPALGGHDWRQPGAQPHLDYFTLPGNGRYYDVRWGPVHLFILDSIDKEPDGVTRTSVQARWFRAAISQSHAPWKIVVVHDPPYSSGETHSSQEHIQWPFRDWGADAVISGNDHVYERLLVGDLPYFVNGLGGGRIYDFDTDEIVPGSITRYNRDHGAMLIEASENRLSFEFITRSGELIDSHLITRDA
jgi:hypothetical protein